MRSKRASTPAPDAGTHRRAEEIKSPDHKIVTELAQYGAAAVPELVKVANEVAYVTTGMMERIAVKPYIPHARAVMASIAELAKPPR
jgi:hypothetical protein